MNLNIISDMSNTRVVDMMKVEFSKIGEGKPYYKNYNPAAKGFPENIFNMLKNNKFKVGSYMVLDDGKDLVCSAGWYKFTPDIALVLVRMYVNPKFRHTYPTGKFILPEILKETEVFNKLWITINEYNKSATIYLTRPNKFGNIWPEIYTKFKPIGSKFINGLDQYIMEHVNE